MTIERYNKRGERGKANQLEVASYMTYSADFLADATAGDYQLFSMLADCKVVDIRLVQIGDEGGTDGVVTIEKWDDVAGSTQTALTSALTLDAGGDSVEKFTLTTTDADLYVDADEIINLKVTTAATNGVTCRLTVTVKLIEQVGVK